jgi:putative FmdB family regulatory protein
MPTYEYACRDCEDHLEVVQSFKDEPLTECPRCGGQLRKVFGNIGISFKGSGFYKTDSRAASSATSKSGASAESKSEATSEPKTGSKSEAKSDSSKSDSSKADSSGGSERKSSKSSSGEAKAAAS